MVRRRPWLQGPAAHLQALSLRVMGRSQALQLGFVRLRGRGHVVRENLVVAPGAVHRRPRCRVRRHAAIHELQRGGNTALVSGLVMSETDTGSFA